MITSITIFERTHMQHEQQKAQEEEKKRLFEEELEWKTWVAFWIKVHFVCVPVHACIVLVHVLFHSFSQIRFSTFHIIFKVSEILGLRP